MSNTFRGLALIGLAIGGIDAANAAMTSVHSQGNFGNERCLVGNAAGLCVGGAYDGAVSIIHAMEMDLDLATGAIARVDDSFDQIWTATIDNGGRVLARARYADHDLDLGFDAGGGYVKLMDNIGDGRVRVGSPNEFNFDTHDEDFQQVPNTWQRIPLNAGALFAFILRDLTVNPDNYWTSNNSGPGVGSAGYANSGGDDHMVTFRVNQTHYFLAFEDLLLGQSDHDFNDMVVEVKFVNPVPLPAALPLLLSGIAGLGFLRRRAARV
jgi:uncharacterized protein DUF4114